MSKKKHRKSVSKKEFKENRLDADSNGIQIESLLQSVVYGKIPPKQPPDECRSRVDVDDVHKALKKLLDLGIAEQFEKDGEIRYRLSKFGNSDKKNDQE